MNDIRIMIADDQRLMRDGLRLLLELEEGLLVVGEAADGREAVELYQSLNPDVVLMDIRMPHMTGVEATKEILTRDPQARIIILTTFDDENFIWQGLQAGALGYMLKDLSGAELAQAIRTVMAGGSLLDPTVTRKLLNQFSQRGIAKPKAFSAAAESLSVREVEILKLVAEGLSNPAIGRQLHLAEGTVKNYVSGILQKLNVRDRTQAAVLAQEQGWI